MINLIANLRNQQNHQPSQTQIDIYQRVDKDKSQYETYEQNSNYNGTQQSSELQRQKKSALSMMDKDKLQSNDENSKGNLNLEKENMAVRQSE